MQITRSSPVAIAFLVAGVFSLQTQATQDDPKTPLHECMETLGAGYKSMRRQVRDTEGNREKLLDTLADMQRAALTAYGLPPDDPDPEHSQEDRAQWRIGFQRGLLEALDTLLALELAVRLGRQEEAQEAFRALSAVKKAGHEKYVIDEQ